MLATQLTNYVQTALSQLLTQYQGRPRIAGFYTAFADQAQELENAIFSLDAGRQIWNGTTTPAVGAQLDGIGEIVGIARNGLSDQEYTLLLFGKISENFSDDTIASIINVTLYVFGAVQILIQEIYPAGIYVVALGATTPTSLFNLVSTLIQNSAGAGIKVVLAQSPVTNVFRFSGPGVVGSVNGFGSIYTPGSGGVFVGLV